MSSTIGARNATSVTTRNSTIADTQTLGGGFNHRDLNGEYQRLTFADRPPTLLVPDPKTHDTSKIAPNTRSRACDPSATDPTRDEQLASTLQRCDEEIENELHLQTEIYKHRRHLLKLEAEHELEHRQNMQHLEMEIRKAMNEIELRQCSDKLNMRLGYERASMRFRKNSSAL